MRRGRLAAAAAALTVAVLALAPTGRVAAHASLEASVPAANSVLESGPSSIVLDFDEAVDAGLASIRLFDQTGAEVPLGTPTRVGDSSIVQATAPELGDGTYAVVWRVASVDGHVVDGAFSFQIGTTGGVTGSDLIDRVSKDAVAAPIVGRLLGVARFLALLGFIVVAGAGLFALGAPASRAEAPSTRVLLRMGWVWLLVGSAASFGLYGARVVAGGLGDAVSPSVWSDIVRVHTGRMLLLRTALAVALGVLLALFRFRREGWWRASAIAAVAASLVSFSASGHANALDDASIWIAVDGVHLAAVSVWIGGLLLLAFGGRAWLTEPAGEATVRRFSRTAVVAVPVIVATGVAQTLRLAGGLDDVTATVWGRALVAKVAIVVVLVAIGGVGRWLLQHDGPASLRRTVLVEGVLGIAVVGLAAGLVALPPRPSAEVVPFTTTMTTGGVIVDVTLTPARSGANEVHLVVTTAGGSLQPIAGLTARMSLPSADIPNSPVTVVREGPNHYSGTITLPRGGEWTLEVIVEPTPDESTLLSTTVPIAG
jgi:copper transport protein